MEQIPYRVYFLSCSNFHLPSTAMQSGKNHFIFTEMAKQRLGLGLIFSG